MSKNYNSKPEKTMTASKMFREKRRGCSLCLDGAPNVDYKDPEFLKTLTSECGRMLPSRITNVCAKHQRSVKKAIRHSRVLALMPFILSTS